MTMVKEIERKWVVKTIPDINRVSAISICQGYLLSSGDAEVRVRKSGKDCTLTVKNGSGMTRDETEIRLSSKDFEGLWEATAGRRVYKFRHQMQHNGVTLELDTYSKELMGLHVVEAEFRSEEEAKAFNPPDWFGKEVTDDKRYSNRSLAENGIPKE